MNRKKTPTVVVYLVLMTFASRLHAAEARGYAKIALASVVSPHEIPLKIQTPDGRDRSLRKWDPLGGGGIDFKVGYHILPRVGVEVGLGAYARADDSRDWEGSFIALPVTATGLFHFHTKGPSRSYAGFGITSHHAPELERLQNGAFQTRLRYRSAVGHHVLFGQRSMLFRNSFLFLEMKYVRGLRYKFMEGIENGVRFTTSPFREWDIIKQHALMLSVGLGFHF